MRIAGEYETYHNTLYSDVENINVGYIVGSENPARIMIQLDLKSKSLFSCNVNYTSFREFCAIFSGFCI